MDGSRFDDLARGLATGTSRRTLLKRFGIAAVGAVGLSRVQPAAAEDHGARAYQYCFDRFVPLGQAGRAEFVDCLKMYAPVQHKTDLPAGSACFEDSQCTSGFCHSVYYQCLDGQCHDYAGGGGCTRPEDCCAGRICNHQFGCVEPSS